MDNEHDAKRGGGVSRLLWLAVIAAIVLLWWFFKPAGDKGNTLAEQQEDAAQAVTDPDDILVDLVDDVTPDQIAALERAVGIKLVLVDDTAAASKLYRAHVDPSREAEVIQQLSARSDVEIAEPDSTMQLDPSEEAVAATPTKIDATHEG